MAKRLPFKTRLSKLRKRKRLTQVQAAALCHVTQATWSRWEAGLVEPAVLMRGAVLGRLKDA